MSLGNGVTTVVQREADDVAQLRAMVMELRERQTRTEGVVRALVEKRTANLLAELEFMGELSKVMR